VTINASGITISNGGASSVFVSASAVKIVNGDITVIAAGQTLRMDPANPSAPLVITRSTGEGVTVAANNLLVTNGAATNTATANLTGTELGFGQSGFGALGLNIYGFDSVTDAATHTVHTPYTGPLPGAPGRMVSGGIIY
jgi:hypothetical protein